MGILSGESPAVTVLLLIEMIALMKQAMRKETAWRQKVEGKLEESKERIKHAAKASFQRRSQIGKPRTRLRRL
jgi:siroheme synthase (precorrin-2 oxidase/ferrochelatase)